MQKLPRVALNAFAVFLGIFFCLLLVELTLRIGNIFVSQKSDLPITQGKLILFSGDSWSAGADASRGKGYFDLLKADPQLNDFCLVNAGYGSNNYFQIVNSIVNYKQIPSIVVINGGINAWHLIGLEQFISNADNYFTTEEIKALCKDFKFNCKQIHYYQKLKVYKLFVYLANLWHSTKEHKSNIDIKKLDRYLTDKKFWPIFIAFRERYQDLDTLYKVMPDFLKSNQELSLDQKFYFVALNVGFNVEKMEDTLKKAGLFYPQKLKIFLFDVYSKLDASKVGISPEAMFRWSFELLKRWSKRHKVQVIVQTYPDIKKEGLGEHSFAKVNVLIKLYAKINGFAVIDYNSASIDWKEYRTCWHVNNEGHALMKEVIKKYLLEFPKTPM